MVATLGRMSEMAVAADKPSMATISPKLSKDGTLLHILGCVAMAAGVALGSVFHLGTGGVFLGDVSKKMAEETNSSRTMDEKADWEKYPQQLNNRVTADDDDFVDGYYRRGF